jgi:hypothetical protein
VERVAKIPKQHEHSAAATCHARDKAPAATPISSVLQLQQQVGNQAVQQLLRSGYIQAKLAISNPDDPEELEADEVAHKVVRAHAGFPASAACSCSHDGEMCEECQQEQSQPTIQRRASAPSAPAYVPRIVSDVLRSPGHPLDSATRAFFEPRFGHDFSKVRVHTDARAAESAKTVDAYAYTVGHDIAFAAGQFRPDTDHGRSLLAHEFAHVVQQSRVEPSLQRAPSRRSGQPPPSPAPQGDCPKREPGEASASSIQFLVRVPEQEYLIYGFPVASSLVDMTKWDFVSLTIAYSLAKRAQLAKGGVTDEVKILGYSDCGENERIRMERPANFCGEMMKICKDEYGHRALFLFSPSCSAAAPQTYVASNATQEDRRQNRGILIRLPPAKSAKSPYAYDETYGPTAANCDHYLTMRDWLSPAYAHNAYCACIQTPDEPHNNCVRKCLKTKAWMFVFEHRNDLRTGRLAWWCPNIWIQHRECYQECGCDHTFIDYLGFMIMCEQEMSCGATGLAIGLLNQCMG